MRDLAFLVGAALLVPGCWVSGTDPPPPVPPSCNNNGQCEDNEDCNDCPADCPCCSAVTTSGEIDVDQPANATREPDGKVATLGANSTLTLMVGREIYTDSGGADFVLVGSVESDSSVPVSGACPVGAASGAGYIVDLSQDGSTNWTTVGFWTRSTSPSWSGQGQPFGLSCASPSMQTARYLRLSPFGTGASAKLDALVAISCVK